MTALERTSPSAGPALTITALIADLDHYKDSFGRRILTIWHNCEASVLNMPPTLLAYFGQRYQREVSTEDLFAYIAAIAAHQVNVLGRLIEIEPAQAELLERVCNGPTITIDELRAADAFEIPASSNRKSRRKSVPGQESFFD